MIFVSKSISRINQCSFSTNKIFDIVMMINRICSTFPIFHSQPKFFFSSGATFLKMVESFFDRASVHTGIRTDRLNFYKKAENIVKCSIPLVRGTFSPIQIMDPSKPSQLIVVNTKLTNCRQKEELDMQRMSISKKSKPLPVS